MIWMRGWLEAEIKCVSVLIRPRKCQPHRELVLEYKSLSSGQEMKMLRTEKCLVGLLSKGGICKSKKLTNLMLLTGFKTTKLIKLQRATWFRSKYLENAEESEWFNLCLSLNSRLLRESSQSGGEPTLCSIFSWDDSAETEIPFFRGLYFQDW